MRRGITTTSFSYDELPSSSGPTSVEEENEEMTDHLKDKISTLKSLSIDIGNEVNYQDKMLHTMEEDFDRTSNSLSSSVARIFRLSKGCHKYYILYLFLLSLVVFFILWVVLKFKQ